MNDTEPEFAWYVPANERTAHAYGQPGYRSVCGQVRWTAAVRDATSADPRCPACIVATSAEVERDARAEAAL